MTTPEDTLAKDSYTQAEFAERVGRSRQRVGQKVKSGDIITVNTQGGTPLIPKSELDRVDEIFGKRGRPRKSK